RPDRRAPAAGHLWSSRSPRWSSVIAAYALPPTLSDARGEQRCSVAQRQLDREPRAATGSVGNRNPPPMVRDDAMDDRQAQAGAALGVLGREVRRKHLVLQVGWHARAIVVDHQQRAVVGVAPPRADHDLAAVARADRVACVL